MNKILKRELKTAFTPPPPTYRNEFLNDLPYPRSSNFEFFLAQISYIRKRFWCLSGLVVISFILFTQMYVSTFKVIGMLSAFLPFLVVFGVNEISRSSSYNMVEMEMSCKYNLSKITFARLSLIGSFYFIIILCMVMIFSHQSEYSFLQFTLFSMTPFLLCSYLSLFINNHFPQQDTSYVCAGVAGITSISIFLLANRVEVIYMQKSVVIWSAIFIVTVILLGKEIKNLLKRAEELQWNSSLIV